MTKTKPAASELGYTKIRVSKRAHQELLRRSISERRTIVAQLDLILGL